MDVFDAVLNLAELEALARSRLSQLAWDYFASGADDELSLRRNLDAYRARSLYPRVLVDVTTRTLTARVLGQPISFPVMVAPTAFHGLAHPDAELASVRGAGDAGTVFVLSTLSNTRVEDVVAAASGPVWFQLYVYKDRAATQALVRRVEAAGCAALVVTVDAPLLGRRERDVRNRFALPSGLRCENLTATDYARVERDEADSGLAAYFSKLLDPGLSWRDLAWLRQQTRLPILFKGVMRADDARRAVDAGAAGIVVSNHGGRQLDTAAATLEALPAIAAAVGGRTDIYLDGGVRRGTDVIKALALGAQAVWVGRPILWGLAVAGRAGVAFVLETLRRELDLAMALCGCPSLTAVSAELLAP